MKRVYVVDGVRTPFLRARGTPGPFSAADLAVWAARPLLARVPIEPREIDEVVVGCVIPAPDEANIARLVGLRVGCGMAVPAFTVQRNCASGLQALASAAANIRLGRSRLVLAGGTEAMSRAPIQWNAAMSRWIGETLKARSLRERLAMLARLRPAFLKPVFSLVLGLTDPLVALSMGQTAEVLAHRFGIARHEQDSYALRSHERLGAAWTRGTFTEEVEPVFSADGEVSEIDTGLRRDTDLNQLARLRPAFDKPYGSVTSGNSSQVTDGAAMLLLASEDFVRERNLPVLGEILDDAWAGVDPRQMGLGPVHAVAKLFTQTGVSMRDLALMELNEAFAAQVLACEAAWDSRDYARAELGRDMAIGAMDPERLNVDGGAIALGHPIGASGARLVLHLLRALQSRRGGLGVATLCIGGGQGGAMLVCAEGA
ncbi:MAG: acetyl-CoA C-acetyltransferase [Acidiferrobacteraceae bacterium]